MLLKVFNWYKNLNSNIISKRVRTTNIFETAVNNNGIKVNGKVWLLLFIYLNGNPFSKD